MPRYHMLMVSARQPRFVDNVTLKRWVFFTME